MTEESIFATALELKTGQERQAYLDQACAENPELRAQVEDLLRANADAGSFLNHPPAGLDATIEATSADDTVNSNGWAGGMPFLEPCDTPGRLGKLVGKAGEYEIIEVVGQGGMGAVLRAFDVKLSRIVAVKVMAPELAANPTAVKRFLREAQTAAAVHHDHVVTIHAIDDTHRPPFIVMQFVEGQTLQQKLDREGALELKQILRIGSQMAAGLAAAHKHGLIHRDVKPANVLLENGVERVKITDFGLARAADDLDMTQTGVIAGTPQYMSPEQAKGEPIDTRSDLFSLGSVLYSMCTGRPAFRADNTMAVMRRVCDDAPRAIREVNREIPSWLEAIVSKLLAKNPAERFQSAGEVAELLGQHLAHLQNPAQVVRPATVVTTPVYPTGGQGMVSKEAMKVRRESSLAFKLVLGIVALVFGLPMLAVCGSVFLYRLASTNQTTITVQTHEPDVIVSLDGDLLPLSSFAGERQVPDGPNWVGFAIRSVEPGRHHVRALVGNEIIYDKSILVRQGESAKITLPRRAQLAQSEGLPLAAYRLLDLQPYGNERVSRRYPELKPGKMAYSQIPFEIGEQLLHLSGDGVGSEYPRSIPEIAVARHVGRLHVLHATQAGAVRDTPVANYRMHYADGTTADWSILHGRDVDGYLLTETTRQDNPAAQQVAYRGLRAAAGERAHPVRLFYGSWQNPAPEKEVASIEFQSLHAPCAPFCVAITIEEDPSSSSSAATSPPIATAPFDADAAAQHQATWAAHLDAPLDYENSLGMVFRLIPPGEFLMGGTQEETDALVLALEQGGADDFDKFVARTSAPQHQVRITKPFYLGAHEVTVGQYRQFIEETKHISSMEQLGIKRFDWTASIAEPDPEQRAVIGVSWDDAKAFCKWLSEKDERTYDLPSEAQWEHACRAGTDTAWSFGGEAAALSEHAVFGQPSFWPAEVVGSRKPNPFGLYDMHGNADEWCLDWHDHRFYANSPVDDPVCLTKPDDKNSGRVARGGTAISAPWWTRSTTRAWDFPQSPVNPKGFRVAIVGDLAGIGTQPTVIARSSRVFTGEMIRDGDTNVFGMAWSAQGNLLATGHYDGPITVWNLESGEQVQVLAGHTKTVNTLAFSPDGKFLATGGEDSTIRLWNVDTWEVAGQLDGHTGWIACLAFIENGAALVSVSRDFQKEEDNTIRIWNVAERTERQKFTETLGHNTNAALAPDSSLVAIANAASGRVRLWSLASGSPTHDFEGQPTHPVSVAFSRDGARLAAGYMAKERQGGEYNDPANSVVRMWDVKSGALLQEFKGHAGPVSALEFSPDDRRLLSLASGRHDATSAYVPSSDQSVRIWDVATGQEQLRLEPPTQVHAARWTPDGTAVCTGTRLWEIPPVEEE